MFRNNAYEIICIQYQNFSVPSIPAYNINFKSKVYAFPSLSLARSKGNALVSLQDVLKFFSTLKACGRLLKGSGNKFFLFAQFESKLRFLTNHFSKFSL